MTDLQRTAERQGIRPGCRRRNDAVVPLRITSSGTFIKTLRRQGPSVTSSKWDSHCQVWWGAKRDTANGGNDTVDGVSGATTSSYSSIAVSWDCRDKNSNLVTDGDYKFYIQYAEDSGQGPSTTTTLQWSKGSSAFSKNYASQGSSGTPADGNNFTQLSVAWTPVAVAPGITSAAPPSTGTVGVPYTHTCAAAGTAPITFAASGLPTGLAISSAGAISGTPEEGGSFHGTITATNGTAPDATQPFSIQIVEIPVLFTALAQSGSNLTMDGTGPANGLYTVLSTTDVSQPLHLWTPVTSDSFDASGLFSFSIPITPGVPQLYYRLRVP